MITRREARADDARPCRQALFVIDRAVPRDADPAINELRGSLSLRYRFAGEHRPAIAGGAAQRDNPLRTNDSPTTWERLFPGCAIIMSFAPSRGVFQSPGLSLSRVATISRRDRWAQTRLLRAGRFELVNRCKFVDRIILGSRGAIWRSRNPGSSPKNSGPRTES